jgi:two-component system, NtrC family, sensor kinase
MRLSTQGAALGIANLRNALIAFIVVPCLLATAIIGWAGLRGLEDQVNQRMQEDLELIARTLRLPLSDALRRGQPGVIQDTIESTVGIDQVYAVYVYDEDGRQVARSGRRIAAVPVDEALELAGQREPQEAAADVGEDQLISVFQPLIGQGGRIRGLLQVTRHSGAVQDSLERVRWMALLGIVATGLLFTGVVVLGYHVGVGRHVARMQARLHRAEKMAAIGRLAGGVAHELGSPLATLYGRAQQLLRRAEPGTPDHEALLAISDASVRMEQTIRQLMDFGRSNPLNVVPVDVVALLRRLSHDASERAREAGVTVEVDAPDAGLELQADALRLEQAVRNLLDNAIHAAASRVRVAADSTADEVRIRVGDDGPGVPEALREQIFDPFFTSKPVGRGTGLGLSVASAVADDHDGRLSLGEDALGGAQFVLVLPREPRDGAT